MVFLGRKYRRYLSSVVRLIFAFNILLAFVLIPGLIYGNPINNSTKVRSKLDSYWWSFLHAEKNKENGPLEPTTTTPRTIYVAFAAPPDAVNSNGVPFEGQAVTFTFPDSKSPAQSQALLASLHQHSHENSGQNYSEITMGVAESGQTQIIVNNHHVVAPVYMIDENFNADEFVMDPLPAEYPLVKSTK